MFWNLPPPSSVENRQTLSSNMQESTQKVSNPASQAVLSINSMQLDFRAASTHRGVSRLVQAMYCLVGKTRRAPSRQCKYARVYGHTTTVMHDMNTPLCAVPGPQDPHRAAVSIARLRPYGDPTPARNQRRSEAPLAGGSTSRAVGQGFLLCCRLVLSRSLGVLQFTICTNIGREEVVKATTTSGEESSIILERVHRQYDIAY